MASDFMAALIYMPYFDNAAKGVYEAQAEALENFEGLREKIPGCEFMLDRRYSATDEDRLPFFRRIWGRFDLVHIESTKIPSSEQVRTLLSCPHLLCSQNYLTNIVAPDGEIFKFPAHKALTAEDQDLKSGCGLGYPFTKQNLRYCRDDEDFCDVTDLGIIKISQAFQQAHAPTFADDDLGYRYNDVERLHAWLLPIGVKWHRHKELARRNQLFHVKNANHVSEYISREEYRQRWRS